MSMVEKETKVVNENKMMVNMTKEALYDFLLFHAYSKFSGYNRKSEWHRSGALSGGSGNIPWRHTVPA